MTGALDGVRSLIVGGANGIGRAVVQAYVAAGADVTVLDQAAADSGPAVISLTGDATDPAALIEAVAAARRAGQPVNQLTMCAGIHDQHARLADMTLAQLRSAFSELYEVNVLSVLLAVRAAQPDLQADGGSITLTLSESAFAAIGGGVLYGSSKWALRGLVAHLARDLAPAVRVNAVAPGGTSGTRLRGLKALAQERGADQLSGRSERIAASNLLGVLPEPSDHASAYVYLAAPEHARVVTGAIVRTDGGHA